MSTASSTDGSLQEADGLSHSGVYMGNFTVLTYIVPNNPDDPKIFFCSFLTNDKKIFSDNNNSIMVRANNHKELVEGVYVKGEDNVYERKHGFQMAFNFPKSN